MSISIASASTLSGFIAEVQQRMQRQLHLRLDDVALMVAPSLAEAMRYAVLLGGKRLRPALVYASYLAFAKNWEVVDQAAMAIELMHAYSLVHDDLPAMDNDLLRRGQPTCHIAFDHATAILAGDALQSLAFEVLAESNLSAAKIVKMMTILAQASGAQGMVGGQALDLAATGQLQSMATESPLMIAEQLARIHRHKTGCLIAASVTLGSLAARDDQDAATQQALLDFGYAVGLGFQIQDDILDITGSTEVLGKTVGSDQTLEKLTYPALLGIEGAKQLAQYQLQTAQDALLRVAQADTSLLKMLANAMIDRSH
jgi:geranylgeranyl pyrophosphate synthase